MATDPQLIRDILAARGQVRGGGQARGVGRPIPQFRAPAGSGLAPTGGGITPTPYTPIARANLAFPATTSTAVQPFTGVGAATGRAPLAIGPGSGIIGAGTGRPPIPLGSGGGLGAPGVVTGGAPLSPYAGPVAAGAQVAPVAGAGAGGAGTAAGAASTAASAGRGAGLLGGLGGAGRALLTRGVGGPASIGAALGGFSAGMANEGTHPATAIPVIGGLADTSGDSTWDQFREGMAFGGPTMGALNVARSGLRDLFGMGGGGGGDEGPEPPRGIHRVLAGFDQAAESGFLDPGTRDQYAGYYNLLLTSAGENNQENRDAAAEQALALVMQDAQAGMANNLNANAPGQIEPVSPEDILAQQAQVAAIVQPYTDAMSANAAARNQMLQGMVGELPGEYQGLMGTALAGQGLAQQQLIQAYGAQSALIPQTLAFDQMMQERQSIAAQLQQQALQAQINPPDPTAGGELDLAALMAGAGAGATPTG